MKTPLPKLQLLATAFVFVCFSFVSTGYGQTSQQFPSSGTFTVPAGVTTILVQAWGGGAGGTLNGKGADGGGGGAYASSVLSVTQGSTYTVTVGSGGAVDANGGNTSFGTAVVAAGAQGKTGGQASGSVGQVKYSGGNGGNGEGQSKNSAGGGGGGSASATGNGNVGGDASGGTGGAGGNGKGIGGKGGNGVSGTNGSNGTTPGAGGGGKGDGGTSGTGANGLVIVYYYSFSTLSTSAASCPGTPSQITIGSASLLANTTYTVSYSLSGANTGNFTATMTVAAAGSGSFSTGNLANPGATTITITNITDGSIGMAPSGTTNTSITVAAQPLPGTLAKTPNKSSVCVGDVVSATLATAGTGGAGTVADVLEYRFDNGTWTSYTAGVNLSTSGHTSVEIRTNRTATGSGCTNSSYSTISWTVNARPTVTISKADNSGNTVNDGIICIGNSVTLTGNGTNTNAPYSFAWVTGATQIATTQAVTVSPTINTDYLVTVTDGNGCTNTETFTVTVNDLPTPAISVAENSGTTDDDGTICHGGSATLTASGGTSYAWSTGSTSAVITVSPTAPSTQTTTTYTVTVKDANGCTAPASKTVTVNPLPAMSSITGVFSVCVGGTTTLANAASGSWSSLNTAVATVNSATGEVTGLTAGNATIQFTVTDGNGCTNSKTANVTVNALPTLSGVSSSTATICSGTSATITLNGLLPNKTQTIDYTIDGGSTQTTTVTANGSGVATFNTTGLSSANSGSTLAITGITRTDVTPNCAFVPSNAQTTLPTVTPIDLTAPVIDKGPGVDVSTVCVGQNLTVTVTTPGSGGTTSPQDEYRYSTSGGSSWSAWSTSVPSFAAVLGTNIIEARHTASGGVCAASGTNHQNWTVVAPPTVSAASPAVQDACLNTASKPLSVNPSGGTGNYSFQWYSNTTNSNSGGSQISGETDAVFTPPTGSLGTTYYYCVVTDAGTGCGTASSATAAVNVGAQPVSGTLTKGATVNTSIVCRGTDVSATLTTGTGTGADVLEYSFDDSGVWTTYTSGAGLSTSGHTKVEIRTYRSAPGTNCTSSEPVSVVWDLNPRPTIDVTVAETSGKTPNDGIICTGGSVNLSGTGSNTTAPYSYAWVTGATTISNTQGVTVSPTVNTDYLLTVTDGNGCARTQTVTVTVNSLPSPTIAVAESPLTGAQDGTICSGGSVTLTASGGSSYSWNTGPTSAAITVSPTAPSTQTTTSYTVDVTDNNGCMAQASKTVTVNPLPVVNLSASSSSACMGTTVTYSTEPGQSGYVWTLPTPASQYTVTGGSTTSNTVTLQWNTSGSKTVAVAYTNSDGCLGTAATVTTTVNSLPAITLTTGTATAICYSSGNQSTTLGYTATSGSPTSYSIDWDNTANSAGLADQGTTNFAFSAGGGTLNTIVVPGNTQPGTYTGILTVTNGNTCVATKTVTLTVKPTMTADVASSSPTLCINSILTPITHSTTNATGIGAATGLPAGVTASFALNTITISGTPTASGIFNYSIPLTGGCGNVSATGTITVTSASVGGSISPATTSVCGGAGGGTLTLSGHNGSIVRWESSINGGTTWTKISNTTTTQAYTTGQTTLYRALVKNGICDSMYSNKAVVIVNPTTTPTAVSSPAAICAGETASLSATAAGYLLAGDLDGTFDRANPPGWDVTDNGKPINFPANADNASTFPWSETNGPKTPFNGGVTYNNLQTGGKFAISSGQVQTTMETPVFSTLGMTNTALQFYQALVFAAGASGKIEISTDGGTTYSKTLIQYNGPLTIGTPANNWSLLNIDLADYAGLSNLRIRFTYSGADNSNWALDGVKIAGQAPVLTYQWTPTATLTPSSGQGAAVTAAPSVTTTYTVVTTINGCPGGSQQVTVTVNPKPTATIAVSATAACQGGGPAVVTFTGAGGTRPYTFTYQVNGGANQTISTTSGSNSVTVSQATGTAGTFTYTLVSVKDASSTQCTQPQSGSVAINIYKPIIISSPASLPVQCWGSTIPLSFIVSGDVVSMQWYKDGNLIPGATTNSYVINSLTSTEAGNYYLVVKGTSPCTDATSGMINVSTYSTDLTIWTCGSNTDEWHDDNNWSCKIPTLYRDALVPIVPQNKYPYIDGTSGLVGQTRDLTIDAGTSVTLDGLLQMAGTVTNNGTLNGYLQGTGSTGTIEFVSNQSFDSKYPDNPTYAQVLKRTTGSPVTKTQNLKISNQVTFQIPVDVYGKLSFGGSNKTLATGDALTLKSVSSTTSAMVMDRTNGSGMELNNQISGQVTVERFIDGALGRKWRLVTAPIQNITINKAWQDGMTKNNGSQVLTGTGTAATPTPGSGTLITGGADFPTAASANGAGFDFWDAIANAQSSIRQYVGNPDWMSAMWMPISGTNVTGFNNHQAYLLFVRGDRTVTAGSGGTVLRPKGTLKENLSYTANVIGGQSHTLIGNPYASPLNFYKIWSDASNSNKIQPYFWVWQSSLSISWGGYALIKPTAVNSATYESVPDGSSTATGADPIISSGQGFFVMPQSPGTSSTITIKQTHKDALNSKVAVFRQMGRGPSKLFTNVYSTAAGGSEILLDGVLAEFGESTTNGNVGKAMQLSENLSVLYNGRDQTVAAAAMPGVGDTLQLRFWNTAVKDYRLRVRSANFDLPGITAALGDRFLKTEQPLVQGNGIVYHNFRVTGEAASKDPLRFYIVFNAAPLPAVTLQAQEDRKGVALHWTVPVETVVDHYELERSVDGASFETLTTVKAKGGAVPADYPHFDANPGVVNDYRVKVVGVAGVVQYSDAVRVVLASPSGVTFYPNPATGGSTSVLFTNRVKGRYEVRLLGVAGQVVRRQVFEHSGGTATYALSVAGLANGSYTVAVEKPDGRVEHQKLVIAH